MWSLYVPIHVKRWPKVISGKVGVGSNIALILPVSWSDQKRNWVKLKSVQTLLRIACLANRKSYVIIIYANACEKLTKSENVSSWSRFKYCSKVWKFYHKRPVSLIAPPFIISFLATGNWPKIKLDDSAFFRTQSYITEICYFEYLLSFGLQKKTFFSQVQSNIKPN